MADTALLSSFALDITEIAGEASIALRVRRKG